MNKNIPLFLGLVLIITTVASYVFGRPHFVEPNIVKIKLENEDKTYFSKLATNLETKLKEDNNSWDLGKIDKFLAKKSWIKSYSIQKYMLNKIDIRINPKNVIAVYVNKSGVTTPIAERQTILPESTLTFTPPAMVVNQKKIFKDPNLFEKFSKIVSRLPDEGAFSKKTIEQASLDKNQNILFHVDKFKIKLNHNETEKKVLRINQSLKYLKTRGITDCVIDADLSQKVLVRLNSPI